MSIDAGTTIIALHGNGGGGLRYERALPFMPDGVALRTPTLPGFGGTPAGGISSFRELAQAALEFVEESPRPRVLLGHGVGGSVALELLQFAASSVDGVILQAPVGAKLDERKFPKIVRAVGADRVVPHMIASRLLRPLWKRLFFRTPDLDPDYIRRFFAEYGRCELFGALFEWINADWFEALEPVDVPAALLWGELERLLTPDHISAFQMKLPRSIVRRVPDWDHFPMVDAPESYATEISEIATQLIADGAHRP